MPEPSTPLAQRVQQSFQKLSESAKALNATSDQLSLSIAEIDNSLQKLNLGVSIWIKIHEETRNNQLFVRYVGYERVNNRWGIALKQVITKTATNIETSQWPFSDGPRWMRVRSLDKIPELLDALATEADKQRAMMDAKLDYAKELAASVKGTK